MGPEGAKVMGPEGAAGVPGVMGPEVVTGVMGLKGEAGSPGLKGSIGSQGEKGIPSLTIDTSLIVSHYTLMIFVLYTVCL